MEVLENVPASIGAASLSQLTKLRELHFAGMGLDVGGAFPYLFSLTRLETLNEATFSQEQLLSLSNLQVLDDTECVGANEENHGSALTELPVVDCYFLEIFCVPYTRILQLERFSKYSRNQLAQYNDWADFWKKEHLPS